VYFGRRGCGKRCLAMPPAHGSDDISMLAAHACGP
jgi:hypothetical protein